MIEIHCPWPQIELTPNKKRVQHWTVTSKHTRKYRGWVQVAAREAGAHRYKEALSGIRSLDVEIEFIPPTRGRRDEDNMISSFKAGQDGIADVIGVDDGRWRTSWKISPKQKTGAVVVRIEPPMALIEHRGTIS